MFISRWKGERDQRYSKVMMTFDTDALPPRSEMVRAMQESDSSYEGIFFTAVRTTGIFCRPTCSARKPKPENVDFFATVDEALAAGYRPCKRCRPLDMADDVPDWVSALLAAAEDAPENRWTNETLMARGIDPVKLRRWFKQHYGMTFHAYIRARRLAAALGSLHEGDSIDGAAFDHGYESVSGFRDAFRKTFGTTPGRAEESNPLLFTRLTTPLGPMLAMAEKEGLVLLEFIDRPVLLQEIDTLKQRYGYAPVPGRNAHLETLEGELTRYFEGKLTRFSVPLRMPGTAFERSVWAMLCAIPCGETRTYGALAASLGKPQASRAVGAANGRNRIAIVVPCHRVIGADGSLTGYGGGQPRKAFLLRLERRSAALAPDAG